VNRIAWVIAGAETGNRKNKVVPKREWVEQIARDSFGYVKPLFMKDSLIPVVGEAGMVREFPWEKG
jgi:protein gp37